LLLVSESEASFSYLCLLIDCTNFSEISWNLPDEKSGLSEPK
jgi:hypothetical protein